MNVRKMELKDIPEIAEIEKHCFSMPWPPAEIERTFLTGNSMFFTAVSDKQVIGYMGMIFVLDEGSIINVAVNDRFRRQGTGRGLLEFLLEQAEQAGIMKISLEVRKSNTAAIKLYESVGFEPVGVRRGFYSNPPEDALIMCRQEISTSSL